MKGYSARIELIIEECVHTLPHPYTYFSAPAIGTILRFDRLPKGVRTGRFGRFADIDGGDAMRFVVTHAEVVHDPASFNASILIQATIEPKIAAQLSVDHLKQYAADLCESDQYKSWLLEADDVCLDGIFTGDIRTLLREEHRCKTIADVANLRISTLDDDTAQEIDRVLERYHLRLSASTDEQFKE